MIRPGPAVLSMAFAVALSTGAAHAQATQPAGAASQQGPRVTVAAVRAAELVETVVVTGTLVPRDEVLIGPEIDGMRVIEILAEEGDRIEKGQVLARLNRDTLDTQLAQSDATLAKSAASIDQAESQIEQARAALDQSRQALRRSTELRRGGYASQAQLDQITNDERANAARLEAAEHWLKVMQAERRAMEAQRRELMVRIARTEVRAPAAGVVSRRSTKVGAVAAMTAEPMFRVIADGEIELEGEVPETRIALVRAGQPAQVATGNVKLTGQVRLVSPEVDRSTRLGKVRITLGPGPGPRVGAFARGTVETARVTGLVVPASAVLYAGADPFVQVVREDRIVSVPVVLGITADARVGVVKGLNAGDRYVVRAGSFLRHGDAVTPVTETAPQAAVEAQIPTVR